MSLNKIERRERIKMRIRKIVSGTQAQPRMTVYRSNKQIYVQFIDDLAGTTLPKRRRVRTSAKLRRWSGNWPRSVPSKRVSRPWRSTATDICITDELKC